MNFYTYLLSPLLYVIIIVFVLTIMQGAYQGIMCDKMTAYTDIMACKYIFFSIL